MLQNGRRRVVITGMGAVTPLANDVETSWKNLLAGESGASEITQFDSSDYFVHFACEVKDFDPSQYIDRKQARRMDRFAQLILAAARQAETDSGLDIAAEADRIGASIATGIGGIKSFQDCYDTLKERGPEAREQAVRRGARRLRDGRGRCAGRARGARARARTGREDLRGARRVRPVVRREARDGARPDRQESRARDEDGVRRRRDRSG